MIESDLKEETESSFPRILFVAFTLLTIATIAYSTHLYYRLQSTITVLNDVRGPVLHQFVNMRSNSNNAVQECFAYVISGQERTTVCQTA